MNYWERKLEVVQAGGLWKAWTWMSRGGHLIASNDGHKTRTGAVKELQKFIHQYQDERRAK